MVDTTRGETVSQVMPTRDFDTKQIAIDPNGGLTVWLARQRISPVVEIEQFD